MLSENYNPWNISMKFENPEPSEIVLKFRHPVLAKIFAARQGWPRPNYVTVTRAYTELKVWTLISGLELN